MTRITKLPSLDRCARRVSRRPKFTLIEQIAQDPEAVTDEQIDATAMLIGSRGGL
jgi:hypothetical protein